MNYKKVCLITPGHIGSNPRLVKEMSALIEAGYAVHIVFTQYMDYLIDVDLKILQQNPKCTFSKLVWTKQHRIKRLKSGLFQKLANQISSRFNAINIFSKTVLNRNYSWQLKQAIQTKADIYIAHNAGALAVAADAAKINQSEFAFDAEDFHRGEELTTLLKRCLISIEDYYLKRALYLTAASPLIAKEYEQLYNRAVTTVLNVFPLTKLNVTRNSNNRGLRLFWFSQTIGKGRGIEEVIQAIGLLGEDKTTLSLLGNITILDKKYFVEIAEKANLKKNQLDFIYPVDADELFKIAAQYDIGLALEQSTPMNRNICLTNKIFTYLTSGLAVIATETLAQQKFLMQYPKIGKTYPVGAIKTLAKIINEYKDDRELLYQTRLNAILLAKEELNWEKESEIFIHVVQKALIN